MLNVSVRLLRLFIARKCLVILSRKRRKRNIIKDSLTYPKKMSVTFHKKILMVGLTTLFLCTPLFLARATIKLLTKTK